MNESNFRNELQEFFNDNLPSLEELEELRDSGKEMSLNRECRLILSVVDA